MAGSGRGGALFLATPAERTLNVTVADSLFSGNVAASGATVAAPGIGPLAMRWDRCVVSGGRATEGGGLLLGTAVQSVFSACSFRGNTAAFHGAVFHLTDTGSTVAQGCEFAGNAAGRGAVAALQDSHSLWLTGSSADSNTAFGGALVWVRDSTVDPSTQLRFENLTGKGNRATVGVFAFLDAAQPPLPPPPPCAGVSCALSDDSNFAIAGQQPFVTLPVSYTVTATPDAIQSGGFSRISVRLLDAYGQSIRSWPDLSVRAISLPGALSGATNNQTYDNGETVFSILRVLGDIGDVVPVSAVVSSPQLLNLTQQSQSSPVYANVTIAPCLDSTQLFDLETNLCICRAGYVFLGGSAVQLSEDPSAGGCAPCPQGLFNPVPGAAECIPCPNGGLSKGDDCARCPDGATCVGTNTPLGIEGYWHVPGESTRFFECKEEYCDSEAEEYHAERLRNVTATGRASGARRRLMNLRRNRQLAGRAGSDADDRSVDVFQPRSVEVGPDGLVPMETLEWLGEWGGVCAEGHTGPLCAVREE